jgi:hypothetical protein
MRSQIALTGLALALAGCGSSEQSQPPVTNIEEMGPMGGSNVTTTPHAGADNAPVGAGMDGGNVAPGNANPNNPRPGATTNENTQ